MDKIDEITMLRNMNIYQKIQAVKKELSERELKKSGENKFSGFKYYELGDFYLLLLNYVQNMDYLHKLLLQRIKEY